MTDTPLAYEGNPHVGLPFDDDDAAIAAALEDLSIPTLLLACVHMTGDLSVIRGTPNR
jgi:4-hydroxyacetophenone monooxygenase